MDTLILVVPAVTKRNDNQLLFFPGVLTYLWDTNWDTNILIWDTLTTITKELLAVLRDLYAGKGNGDP
mgnify:CR=1 FL=1